MAQKINPLSVKLGASQIWYTSFIKYGKNFKCYKNFLYDQLKIFLYLKRFLLLYKLVLESIILKCTYNSVILDIFFFDLNFDRGLSYDTNLFFKTINCWSKSPIVVSFYKRLSLPISAFFFTNYSLYLISRKFSYKKLLQNICRILKIQLNEFKLIQTTNGIKIVKLKGFKLKFSGCFEVSHNQMAKTIKYNFGSLPLTRIEGYVEYSECVFYTKFGTSGLKVWLFYKFK